MNKKIIAIIIGIIVLFMVGYSFLYVPYQENILTEQFDESIKNASSLEKDITKITEKINNQESTDADTLITIINNDINPKYSEELKIINESEKYANDNETKIQYLSYQSRRIELQTENYKSTIMILNAISQVVKGEKSAEEGQNSITRANIKLEDNNKELEKLYDDITELLKENPDLNQTLHELDLEKGFYGEQIEFNQTNNIENTTS